MDCNPSSHGGNLASYPWPFVVGHGSTTRLNNGKGVGMRRTQTEAQVQIQVADYLKYQYPTILFHSDYGSGVKLTMAQAAKQKRQNGGRRAWPDMFIAAPKYYVNSRRIQYLGLFIELKRDGVRIKKKDGSWANEHIEEQAEVLNQLRYVGYKAEFAVGFDQAKELIDDYLGAANG